jgi:FkbM family methyltransferase
VEERPGSATGEQETLCEMNSKAAKVFLRALSRKRIIRKRLPSDLGGGLVFCSPDALLSMWKPGWQGQTENLFGWVRRFVKPDDVIWDVGANQGLFAFAAAAVVGRSGQIIAFEPDPFLSGLMHRSRLVQGPGASIEILPVAISSRCGLTTFCIANQDRALNHLAEVTGNPHTGGTRQRLSVVALTLDWLARELRPPNLIKIDIEGAELKALEGAGHLLHHNRPRLIVEVAPHNADGVACILRDARYRLFDVRSPGAELAAPAWNTFAVPEEALVSGGAHNAGNLVA